MSRETLSLIAFGFIAACGQVPVGFRPETAYTLYRNSITDSAMRVHVASFDAAENEKYNMENCFTARDLFADQPGVTVRYWCERGKYQR